MESAKRKKVLGRAAENENNWSVRTEAKRHCFRKGSKVERKCQFGTWMAPILEIKTSEMLIRESS